MGKQIELDQKSLDELTEEEIEILEEVGLVEKDDKGKPKRKNETRTK
jgi:hypothetical protein